MGREGGLRARVLLALLALLGALTIASLSANVTYDHRALVIDGKQRVLISGSIHYPCSTPELRLKTQTELARDLKSFELKTTYEDVFPAEATTVEKYLQQARKQIWYYGSFCSWFFRFISELGHEKYIMETIQNHPAQAALGGAVGKIQRTHAFLRMRLRDYGVLDFNTIDAQRQPPIDTTWQQILQNLINSRHLCHHME
ncbi:hypothetical protein Nepgr_029121 [Nepenthes gracilis]|uniref:Beta-galactosidase n=1 Tax=Nepenthes gracilis TaxID=150966 RepID=A0AAD3TDN0_NEPGR|nr:hypothetical protein Nepgr_029121 [Nepenthes gracilis]